MDRPVLKLELKKLREEAKLSRQKVEEISGISESTWERVENGLTPTLKVALNVSRFLSVPVEEIWGLVADETKKEDADE